MDRRPVGWTEDEISEEAREDYLRLYVKLRELEVDLDEHGNANPRLVVFSPGAKDVFAQLMDELVREAQRVGFPRRLQGPWAKMPGHLARLSLVLALCRVVDEGELERVESRDVLAATVLLDYSKNQVRRIYVGFYDDDPDDRLAADVAAFLRERGGHWKGSATELHEQLPSSAKPERPDEPSKKLGELAARSSALSVKHGHLGHKRAVTLNLENGVGGVGSSDDCECGGHRCVDCLKQELPFDAA
jgi:hypothetical protein